MSQFCPTCEDYAETKTVEREETYAVRGTDITVPVKVKVCTACGESLSSDEEDQAVLDALHAEYRRQNDLLTPEKIKAIRSRYRLSQKSLALLLGMSEATMNRYEKGGLQDQVHDNAIRACEDPAYVRDLLERRGNLLSDWQKQRIEKSLAGQEERGGTWIELPDGMDWMLTAGKVSEQTGFRRFEYKRFAAALVQLCERMGEISTTVVNKVLFYADFLNYKTATVSLTGTPYRRLQYGPTVADYGILLDRMEADGILVRSEKMFSGGTSGFYYQVGPAADSLGVEFTPHEVRVLEHVAEAFRGCTAKVISDRSHAESAWLNTEDKKLISYAEAATLTLDLPEE